MDDVVCDELVEVAVDWVDIIDACDRALMVVALFRDVLASALPLPLTPELFLSFIESPVDKLVFASFSFKQSMTVAHKDLFSKRYMFIQ